MNIDFARCEFGQEEKDAVNRVLETHWLASGKQNELFEKEFAEYAGAKYAICVNSGSSANLLALASLNLPKGSKVLTSACGFPATLAPILHCNLKPVLVDYDIKTHNIDLEQVEANSHDVKAIIVAHTLGNPVDIERLLKLNIPIIEDCCEAVGSTIRTPNMKYRQMVGTLGMLGTYSFYPSHQITALGTGGMVVTSDAELALRIRSLRDWGKISTWNSYLGDHKTKFDHNGYFKEYSYETVGYNLKMSEAAAAFGREQLKRLYTFSSKRKQNYNRLSTLLQDLNCFFSVEVLDYADPSWFGFVLTFRNSNYNRNHFSDYLEKHGIRTRPFFAGNITKHSPFKKYEKNFPVADKLMKDSLFIGVWPGITDEQLNYMSTTIHNYILGEFKDE